MNSTTKYVLLGIVALLVLYLVFRKPKAADEVEPEGAEPPPQSADGPGGFNPPMAADQEPALSAINSRIEQLYNSAERERVFSRNQTREGLFAGVNYRSGLRQALASVLPDGNPDQVPLIPATINPAYGQKLDFIQDLTSINDLDRTSYAGDINGALQVWKNALDLTTAGGPNFWPSNMVQLIEEGAFGQPGAADRNRSERYHAFAEDFRAFAKNLSAAIKKADNHLRNQAVSDLKAAGWNII